MKIITGGLVLLSATIFLSYGVLAKNKIRPGPYSIHTISPKQLSRDCGTAKTPGTSSIFGSYGSYMDKYPNMGKLSAELDSIRIINRDIRSFAREKFVKAKTQKDNVYRSNKHVNSYMERNKEYISVSNNLKADTMNKYNHGKEILQDTSDYIAEKTLKDIADKLKNKRLNKNFYFGNNYDVLVTCRQFWSMPASGVSLWGYRANKQSEQYPDEILIKPELETAIMGVGSNNKQEIRKKTNLHNEPVSVSPGSQYAQPVKKDELNKWWDKKQ